MRLAARVAEMEATLREIASVPGPVSWLNYLARAALAPSPAGAARTGEDAWRFDEIHPDGETAREVVIDTLLGALTEAVGGLTRALDFRSATPEGLAVKADVRHALANAQKALAWRGPNRERWASPDAPTPPADGGARHG